MDQKVQHIQQHSPSIPILEDRSKLVSLKNCDFDLLYEPSVKRGYKYMVREAILEKIGRISNHLKKEDKTLIIRSAWRSVDHQLLLWNNCFRNFQEEFPEKTPLEIKELTSSFIAPGVKSTHLTGGAVDALIYDNKTKKVMNFGTNVDYKITLSEQCYPYHPDISSLALENRMLLIGLFENEGFVVDAREYWHFDYGNVIWALEKGEKSAFYGIIREQ
ncbi:MAG: M15 family metallopeptidase [Reichenbachiella sp.]|uniref:M15 family metallopeptidase n=1 Tax=Reichenbachiella sp. TaxID=2184521 RepID=UPI003262D238